MAKAGAILMGESPGRKVKDKLVRYGVTSGGIFVLVTLILIFFYLLYVILPIFSSVKVTSLQQFTTAFTTKAADIRVSDSNDHLFRLAGDGSLSAISLTGTAAGDVVGTVNLLDDVVSIGRTLPADQLYALGGESGEVLIAKPSLAVTKGNNALSLSYPLGHERIQLDPKGQPIVSLAASVRDTQAIILGITADGRARAALFSETSNVLGGNGTNWQSFSFAISGLPTEVKDIAVTPDARTAYVLAGEKVYVIAFGSTSGWVREVVEIEPTGSQAQQLALLSGANSLLISHSDQSLSQWFETRKGGKRELVRTRNFAVGDSPVTALIPEYTRKGFFALQQDGQLSAFYTTVKGAIYREPVFADGPPQQIMISPRADRLVALKGNDWQVFDVDNPHPEIGFASLWQKIWYEGYPEPDYVWQSTSGSDEFEPKLSLVPLIFGTLKAALYGLMFAVPLALAGAIYTAYFMSSRMRGIVKPTVELMEALPTVILGFLAGIWLAPIVESHLVGMVALVVMFPVGMLLAGIGWSLLPDSWRSRIPNGFHVLILMPVIVLIAYACFDLSPWLEQMWFAGDVRAYLSDEWGIGYDQRNALVVGIAMGIAVVPTIFSIAEDAIFSVPGHLTSGSLALGATHWQTLTRVVLLTASPGIFSAIMMGLGRAIGETMIVLMATGNTPIMDWNILEGMRTLSATIAIEMPESEVGSSHYRVMFLAAFVLFVFTFMFNTVAELVRQRLREKYSSL
ncbi:ABC transporter permease subunit [Photobacterium sp. ZSDE20]|uniref:ABC transporter permease subunit n=1 Tax=Photobacterium pectinilyticum TaxID=2906793 RepID=A0ABT1MYU1_9GAMM|nr:ABC transporter permease subunit [Photobacterium sp. ZSDE20]MCQ1056997.1 ABC transporter permease subunit [Photobacterium sp. ZSDE20]MDD1821132.1 ABC transporter permease subunit [Photobacterium sp. ZSDE20]